MGKVQLRSTKRVISISVSDDIADFLSKQQNVSENFDIPVVDTTSILIGHSGASHVMT